MFTGKGVHEIPSLLHVKDMGTEALAALTQCCVAGSCGEPLLEWYSRTLITVTIYNWYVSTTATLFLPLMFPLSKLSR